MAEILIRAENHWAESLSPSVRNKWPQRQKDSYARRIRLGDIMRVEADGFGWGDEEGLPWYVLVKVIGLSKAEALQYVDLIEGPPDEQGNRVKLRRKRYGVPSGFVSDAIAAGGVVTLQWADVQTEVIDYIT